MPIFKSDRLVNLRQSRDWYRIVNRADQNLPSEIHIYDEIGYVGVTANDFIKDLTNLKGPIDLHLNTPGGEVFDGIAIYNALKERDVTVYVDSLAASIGSVIAMAGKKIVMSKNASMMIHDGFGMTVGNAADMRKMADLLDKTSDNIASIYADRTGTDVEQWRNAMKEETWYSANEAVAAGLADSIAGKNEVQNKWDLSVFGYKDNSETKAEPTYNDSENDSPEDDFDWSIDPVLIQSAFKRAVQNRKVA